MAKVKTIQMAIGCDLIGSKMSLGHKENEMTERPHGIEILSKKTGRIMLIPYTNIKGYEILPEETKKK